MGERIYTNDGVYIASSLIDHLNTWPDKPCDIKLEDFSKSPPSMMMQQLSGSYKLRSYVNGSYMGEYPFAVYVRIEGVDTESKLDATGCLLGLAKWLNEKDPDGTRKNLPVLTGDRTAIKIELESLPSIAAKYNDGTEDYQALFKMQYKQGGNNV